MATTVHGNFTGTEIHVPYAWTYADAAARTGAGGFVSGDVGKLALQLDDNSLWLLTATTPTWVQVGGSPWLFTQTADNNINNSITELTLFGTGVGTLTLPAGCLTAGRSVRVSMMGYIQNRNSDQDTLQLYLGGNAIGPTMNSAFGGLAWGNRVWKLDALLTCRTTGVTGTLMAQMMFSYAAVPTTADAAFAFGDSMTSDATIDTTGTLALDITWRYDAADAINSITTTNATVELIN